jgi:hypothetical protein
VAVATATRLHGGLRVGVGLACMLVTGCSGPPTRNDWREYSEAGITYSSRPDDTQTCADVLAVLQTHRSAFATFFTLPSLERAPLRYFKHSGLDDFRRNSGCAAEADGCFDGDVHSMLSVDTHELVHAWVRLGFDVQTRFVSEGIATSLSCRPYMRSVDTANDMWELLGFGGVLEYHAAGRFLTQLLVLGSPADLVAWIRYIDQGGGNQVDVEQATQDIYGRAVQEIWDLASLSDAVPCVALGRCNAEPLPMGKVRLGDYCGGQNGYLLSRELGPALGLRAVGVAADVLACSPTAGDYELRSVGVGDLQQPAGAEYVVRMPDQPHLLTLTADDPTLETIVHARPLPAAFASTCTESDPIELSADYRSRIVLPHGTGVYYFPLVGTGAHLAANFVSSTPVPDSITISWCTTCSEGCSVRDLTRGDALSDGATGVLEIAVTQWTADFHVLELQLMD